jgi:hypothetical protein
MLSLTVAGAAELRAVALAMRRGQGTLRSELTAAFKRAGNDTLRKVKRNVTTMDIRGYRVGGRPFREARPGTGLRRRIAAVTELEVSTSAAGPRVRFVVRTDRLGSARKLPFYLDQGRRFRHPIMGNRSRWATSVGKPWFRREIQRDLRRFEAECQKAIDNTIRQIERG